MGTVFDTVKKNLIKYDENAVLEAIIYGTPKEVNEIAHHSLLMYFYSTAMTQKNCQRKT